MANTINRAALPAALKIAIGNGTQQWILDTPYPTQLLRQYSFTSNAQIGHLLAQNHPSTITTVHYTTNPNSEPYSKGISALLWWLFKTEPENGRLQGRPKLTAMWVKQEVKGGTITFEFMLHIQEAIKLLGLKSQIGQQDKIRTWLLSYITEYPLTQKELTKLWHICTYEATQDGGLVKHALHRSAAFIDRVATKRRDREELLAACREIDELGLKVDEIREANRGRIAAKKLEVKEGRERQKRLQEEQEEMQMGPRFHDGDDGDDPFEDAEIE